jgi:hypothetical protein
MKWGDENYAVTGDYGIANVKNEDATTISLTTTSTVDSYQADQDGVGPVTITVEPGAVKAFDLVCLVGTIGIDVTVTAEVFNGAVSQGSATGSVIQPVQQTYIVIPLSLAGDSVEIRFDIGDSSQFNIGYMYAGSLADLPSVRDNALNYTVQSTDPRNVTRAGTSITGVGYETAEIQITVGPQLFSTMRARVKTWAVEGYAVPRLWYFDETCLLTGEAVYGILDADALQIDPVPIDEGGEWKAEMTMGIREVY